MARTRILHFAIAKEIGNPSRVSENDPGLRL